MPLHVKCRSGCALSEVSPHSGEDLACDVALEAADDILSGEPFGDPPRDVVAGPLAMVHAHDRYAVENSVGLAIVAPRQSVSCSHA